MAGALHVVWLDQHADSATGEGLLLQSRRPRHSVAGFENGRETGSPPAGDQSKQRGKALPERGQASSVTLGGTVVGRRGG